MARRLLDTPGEDVVAVAKLERQARRGPFARIALFLRQVVAELRKVVTPTRRELVTYTAVVLGFVVVMMAIVYVLDIGLSALVVFLFGGAS
ncbi:preprotein translocase subunit SecE [Amnibacterium sp.]|uniref:preprotein translocase subunit SecE n=1 Tax=Amnibacterium sp. TaxID=1872496 RepID=UPI002628174C|nr:preprotein translocase subunit SecE [Amnibacterium sp.]MCU1474004.1 secE [Amnibacterium sp.]